jgi:DNA (cytosine-5)-methyltransferase 1
MAEKDLTLKQIRPITELRNWDKNPRGIKDKDFGRLKDQIKKLGQYKPLLITPDGEVLGGNMRLRAYRDLGISDVWVSVVEPKTEAEKLEYALSDNDRAGYYEDDKLAELISQYKDEIDLENYSVDLGKTTYLQDLLDQFSPKAIDGNELNKKDFKDIKILDLYSCIGGNRKLWGDLNVTAVEINPEIAKVYQDYYPNDKMIIEDAHKYLEEHFGEYDFIWASPPCPTHSRLRKNFGNNKPIYPDMTLWQEILFLQGYSKGRWVIENVITWYDPLIEAKERGRHYYWSNFDIPENDVFNKIEIDYIDRFGYINQKKWGFDLTNYSISSKYPKDKILRDMVHPEVGKYILECAFP